MSGKPAKAQTFRRWGLILLGVSIFAPLLSIGTMLYFYLKDELESRRTLAFMNFEQQGYRLKEMLRDESRFYLDRVDGQWQLRFSREPRALLLNNGSVPTVFGSGTREELAAPRKKDGRTGCSVTFKFL